MIKLFFFYLNLILFDAIKNTQKKKTKVHVKSMKSKKTNSKNLLFQLTLYYMQI